MINQDAPKCGSKRVKITKGHTTNEVKERAKAAALFLSLFPEHSLFLPTTISTEGASLESTHHFPPSCDSRANDNSRPREKMDNPRTCSVFGERGLPGMLVNDVGRRWVYQEQRVVESYSSVALTGMAGEAVQLLGEN